MPVSPSRAPAVLADRYRIEGPLGRGGMAEVCAGTDLRLQRPVAVKFLLPEMAARDDIRRRFEAEARSAASLSDPHAVAVFDTGEHDGLPYIVMERLPGETLADRIAQGPVDPDWLRGVAREVLGALAAAHAAGLVHRDVKPGNILLTADGHAKIADFGIAKSVEGPGGDLTGTGQLLGTPAYLAPERLDGAPATPKSDLHSLGVVMYEALAGRCPFPGDTPLATARAVAAGDYVPLAEVRPGLDPDLVATVERAMATDPDRRFDTATAMAAALAPAVAGEPTLVDGAVVAPTTVIGRSRLADTDDIGPLGPVPPRPRGRVPLALLAGLLFVVLLVAGLNREDGSASSAASSGTTETTAAAPPSTAPLSPTAALAAELRAYADRLGPADGARAGDLAASLRSVADQLQAGNPAGPAAT
ncbi:MAG TPA: serine/threonine-protein kinase, partial [Acidimicrobiales bacterium]|nr:serine/threonine-protein kinase [Acidimicrobiales bacterium]